MICYRCTGDVDDPYCEAAESNAADTVALTRDLASAFDEFYSGIGCLAAEADHMAVATKLLTKFSVARKAAVDAGRPLSTAQQIARDIRLGIFPKRSA